MTITQPLVDRLLKDQHDCCWKCGRTIPPFQVHHAVYGRDVRFQKYLDMPENLILLCPRCHANHGSLSNIHTRRKVWKWKIEQGYEMQKWHESIPMIVKDQLND